MDQDASETPVAQGFDPNHLYATPSSRIDLSQVKPHDCMTDVVQKGNYIHCYTGHHGIRLKPNQILNKKNGQYVIEEMVVQESPKLPPKRKRGKV